MRRWVPAAIRPRLNLPVVAAAAQASAGASDNQAVQAAADDGPRRRAGAAPPWLRINGDAGLEAEADRAAAAVIDGRPVGPLHAAGGGVQRKCASCGDEWAQAKAEGGAPAVGAAPVARPLLGHGRMLDAATRRALEPRFGVDFSGVRIHDHGPAAAAGRAMRARAFTVGSDIVFAPGQFAPHTEAGTRLLAHELAHVVQQAGGAPHLQGNGGLTDAELEMLRRFIAGEDTGGPATIAAHPTPSQGASTLTPFGAPMARPWAWPDPDRPRSRLPGDPLDASAFDDGTVVCPSCHQTPAEQRAAARRRDAERRERERREAWPGMVADQYADDLAAQAATLADDIEISRMSVMQVRLRMFDRVVGSRGAAAAPARLPDEAVRSAGSGAAQAAVVLEATLAASSEAFPPEVASVLRAPFVDFLDALTGMFDAIDVERARIAASDVTLGDRPTICPGSCHAPPRPAPMRVPALLDPTAGGHFPASARPRFVAPAPGTGYLGRERTAAAVRTAGASAPAAWQTVLRDFQWAQGQLDNVLRERLRELPDGESLIEEMNYSEQLLARQETFRARHPDALKVQAVFYPRHEFASRRTGEGGHRDGAKAIPWQFYLTRTPVVDRRHVPTGYTWELHDITAPRRDDRTVRTRHVVTAYEGLARERGPWRDSRAIDEVDPPTALFDELNHRDFFPEGELHLRSPITGRHYGVTMTADIPFGDWLTYIGMTIALLGSLAFAPMSTPMLVAVIGGTALTAAGRVHRHLEREEHGVAEPGEARGLLWDLSLDLVSALTLGLGRVATAGLAAGSLTRSSGVVRGWFFLRRAQVALGTANIGVITHDFVRQYTAIQDSRMTPEQKRAALAQLTVFALGSGAMSFASLRADVRDLNAPLRLDPDLAHPGRLVATVDSAVDAAGHGATRPAGNGRIIGRGRYVGDDGKSHSFALWSDGRMTRCSGPPCPHPSDVAAERVDAMRARIPDDDARHETLNDILADARRLRDEANRVIAGPPRDFEVGRERVLRMAQELEARLMQMERRLGAGAPRAPRGIAQPHAPTGTVVGRVTRAERDTSTSAPLDWPVQRVQPDDLPDTVPAGVVFEYPTGERVWRAPGSEGGVVIESTLAPGRRRAGFEHEHFRRGEMGREDYVSSDLELAHSQGAGTGHESPFGILYAPREVNQELQNLGIEEFMRTMVRNPTPGVTLQQVTRTRAHPRTRLLSQIDYAVYAMVDGERRLVFSVSIRVDRLPGGGRRASIVADETYVNPAMARVLPIGELEDTMLARRRELMTRRGSGRR